MGLKLSLSLWQCVCVLRSLLRLKSTLLTSSAWCLCGFLQDGLPCPYCPTLLKGKPNLQDHIRAIHMAVKKYRCKQCGEAFKWRNSLSRHRRTVCPYPNRPSSPEDHTVDYSGWPPASALSDVDIKEDFRAGVKEEPLDT